MKRYDSTCDVCGSHAFHPFARRSDGILVVACNRCGHGVVESFTDKIEALYGDEYFASEKDSSTGYEDYSYMAESGLAWAAELVHLLRPSGSALDIGCATGRLLTMLGPQYEWFGIELNEKMSGEARRAGVSMLARDLLDEASLAAYAGRFDVALAIAVFEHIPKFRQSFESAIRLLQPDGLLLFEVPLIRAEDDIWFRSSLEHLHYPTEQSLHYLFKRVLGLPLAGTVVEVENYGCVYVGLTSVSPEKARADSARFEYLRTAPPAALSREEGRFRWFFDLIHAAKTNPEILAMPLPVGPEEVNPLILRRVFDLWAARELRWKQFEDYIPKIEEARDWHAAQSQRRDDIIANLQQQLAATGQHQAEPLAYLQQVEKTCDWHAAKSQKRDKGIAGLQQQMIAATDRHEEQKASQREAGGLVDKLQLKIASEESRGRTLTAVLASRERRIQEFETSLSWRMTAPLRRVASVFGRFIKRPISAPTRKM